MSHSVRNHLRLEIDSYGGRPVPKLDPVPSINSSCMRLANFLQPECFGRLHVGRFKSRRRLYSGGRGVSWCEVRQPFRAGRLKQRVECNNDGDHRPLEWLSLCPSPVTLPGEARARPSQATNESGTNDSSRRICVGFASGAAHQRRSRGRDTHVEWSRSSFRQMDSATGSAVR